MSPFIGSQASLNDLKEADHAMFPMALDALNAMLVIKRNQESKAPPQIVFRGRPYKVEWVGPPSQGAVTEAAALYFKTIQQGEDGRAEIGGVVEISDGTRFKNPVHTGTVLFTAIECTW